MPKFEEIVSKALKEAQQTRTENMLNININSWTTFAVISGTLILNSINAAAKTNYDALYTNHEIIAKYEHGGKGYGAVSKDCYGGYSYGKLQISTWRKNNKPSTFDFFMKYVQEHSPKTYHTLNSVGGQPAAFKGDKHFINTWKSLARKSDFRDLYDKFIHDTQIKPVYRRMDKSHNKRLDRVTSWSSTNNAIQAAIKSTIIQHGSGGAYKIISNIMNNINPETKEEFLSNIYRYRKKHYPQYAVRYNKEYRDLLAYLHSDKAIISIKQRT